MCVECIKNQRVYETFNKVVFLANLLDFPKPFKNISEFSLKFEKSFIINFLISVTLLTWKIVHLIFYEQDTSGGL